MNLTAQQIKDNFTPYELYTIVNNYLEDGEFIKYTDDYVAELQKESLRDLRLDLDVLNSYNIDFSDKYIVAVSNDMYSTNELADCLDNHVMNSALEQYVDDYLFYDDLASKISSLINPIIELKGTFETQDDAIKVTEFLNELGYATNDDEVIILDYGK